MFKHKPARLLQVPSMQRCCGCRELRFAIASQALIHQPSNTTHFRWICEICGHKRGLRPTPDYLRKFREMNKGDKAKLRLKVLVKA